MPLFEVAILYKASKKELEDGAPVEKLIFGPKAVVAKNEQGAAILASRSTDIPADTDPDRMEVLIRPFG